MILSQEDHPRLLKLLLSFWQSYWNSWSHHHPHQPICMLVSHRLNHKNDFDVDDNLNVLSLISREINAVTNGVNMFEHLHFGIFVRIMYFKEHHMQCQIKLTWCAAWSESCQSPGTVGDVTSLFGRLLTFLSNEILFGMAPVDFGFSDCTSWETDF